jgi:hypothetical protein
LPAGVWVGSTSQGSCSISGSNLLTCSLGTLANGASATSTVSKQTTAQDCGTINNTVTVAATNEPASATGNNTDSGSITVLCADITLT